MITGTCDSVVSARSACSAKTVEAGHHHVGQHGPAAAAARGAFETIRCRLDVVERRERDA
jgi:hypothetical protein